ncbi:tumor necrosis factor ligand superfamily member 15 [Sorex fumeus]|uniref:tumor necrosis factor ligand superfamily member 15 n=1 Tax=Sorex fumeus TaxID=62283 RepID=UPI0024AD2337|nr:tumor necrosis factor ligand superfamily member 15 [Sorex fumeus]
MAENVGEAIRVEMLQEDHSYGPQASAGRAARSDSRRNGALTCCLLSIPILAVLVAYQFIYQTQIPEEGCMSKVSKTPSLPSPPKAGLPNSTREKPRAHLTVEKQTPTQSLGNVLPVLRWQDKVGLAFTKNQMNYTNKFLMVPERGEYFVYSQITFRGTRRPCGTIDKANQDNKPESIVVVITKVSNRDPGPIQLLRGTKSMCEISSNWFQPIYLGAMFSLHKGDMLMVNVSDIKLVDYTKEDRTFFGAFLL